VLNNGQILVTGGGSFAVIAPFGADLASAELLQYGVDGQRRHHFLAQGSCGSALAARPSRTIRLIRKPGRPLVVVGPDRSAFSN
jgi:hypothetical protein